MALADLTEREWSLTVYELLDMLAWDRYHTYRSKKSRAGYPDETCWRERVLWLELKREGGKLSEEQQRVVRGLLAANAEIYVVRPSALDVLAKVLAYRGDPFAPLVVGTDAAQPALALR